MPTLKLDVAIWAAPVAYRFSDNDPEYTIIPLFGDTVPWQDDAFLIRVAEVELEYEMPADPVQKQMNAIEDTIEAEKLEHYSKIKRLEDKIANLLALPAPKE